MGKLERARLIPVEPPKNANEEPKSLDEKAIEVCFNPKEYSLEKTVSWKSEQARSDDPRAQFSAPVPMTLSVTLQFDTYEERVSVRDKYVRPIEALTMMRGTPKDDKDELSAYSPMMVIFQWGAMTFQGVIESLSQKYTMFLSDGTPVRAECALKIRKAEKKDLDKTAEADKIQSSTEQWVTVQQGDRLDTIAGRAFGDPSRWKEIAEANGIVDPKPDYDKLEPGKRLRIP